MIRLKGAAFLIVILSLFSFMAADVKAEENLPGADKVARIMGVDLNGPIEDVKEAYAQKGIAPMSEDEQFLSYSEPLVNLGLMNATKIEYQAYKGRLASIFLTFEGTDITHDVLNTILAKRYGPPRGADDKKKQKKTSTGIVTKEWFSKEVSGLKIVLFEKSNPIVRYKYLPLTIPMEDETVNNF